MQPSEHLGKHDEFVEEEEEVDDDEDVRKYVSLLKDCGHLANW